MRGFLLLSILILGLGAHCQLLNSDAAERATEAPGKAVLFLTSARLKGHAIAILGEESSEDKRWFSVLNISNRTIQKVEIFFFALDKDGQIIKNTYNTYQYPMNPNLVLSQIEGTIKPGHYGDVSIPLERLPGWTSTKFNGYQVTFEDGSTQKSTAPASEFVMKEAEASVAAEALRQYDQTH